MNMVRMVLFVTGGLLLMPVHTYAHPILAGIPLGFSTGFMHPLSGFDHILAMLAVGIWAGKLGGRYMWRVPAGFLAAAGAGFMLAMATMANPVVVEEGIAASLVCLGGLIAVNAHAGSWRSVALVVLFGMFHGLAHGAELPVSIHADLFVLGFLTASALLHAAGIFIGRSFSDGVLIRTGGAGIAVAGLLLIV